MRFIAIHRSKTSLLRTLQLSAVCTTLLAGTDAEAGGLVLQTIDTGYYTDDGFHDADEVNYIVGQSGSEYRNFSVFDLSNVNRHIWHATLRLFNGSTPPNSGSGYSSVDPFETYEVFDVITDVQILRAGNGGVAAFEDLGGGIFFGSENVTAADNGRFVEIVLNEDCITDLNATTGLVAFGGAITTISPVFQDNEFLFAFSHESPQVQLVISFVPESAGISSAFISLCALVVATARVYRFCS